MTNLGKMAGLLTVKFGTLLGGEGGEVRVSLPWILDMVVSRVLRSRPNLVPGRFSLALKPEKSALGTRLE